MNLTKSPSFIAFNGKMRPLFTSTPKQSMGKDLLKLEEAIENKKFFPPKLPQQLINGINVPQAVNTGKKEEKGKIVFFY